MTETLRDQPLASSMRMWRRACLLLLTALVLMQTLGVMHRVAHAHHLHRVAVTQADTDVPASPELFSCLQRLWGEHSNTAECQLFDQSCPDAWHTPAWVGMLMMPATSWLLAALRERFALFERFYAARGPPAVLF